MWTHPLRLSRQDRSSRQRACRLPRGRLAGAMWVGGGPDRARSDRRPRRAQHFMARRGGTPHLAVRRSEDPASPSPATVRLARRSAIAPRRIRGCRYVERSRLAHLSRGGEKRRLILLELRELRRREGRKGSRRVPSLAVRGVGSAPCGVHRDERPRPGRVGMCATIVSASGLR